LPRLAAEAKAAAEATAARKAKAAADAAETAIASAHAKAAAEAKVAAEWKAKAEAEARARADSSSQGHASASAAAEAKVAAFWKAKAETEAKARAEFEARANAHLDSMIAKYRALVKEASKAESESQAEDEFASHIEHRSTHRSSLRGYVSHRSLYSRYQDYCRGPRSGRKLKICIVIDMVQSKLANSELNRDEVDNDKLLHAFMSTTSRSRHRTFPPSWPFYTKYAVTASCLNIQLFFIHPFIQCPF